MGKVIKGFAVPLPSHDELLISPYFELSPTSPNLFNDTT
jgi:hypothetical protein